MAEERAAAAQTHHLSAGPLWQLVSPRLAGERPPLALEEPDSGERLVFPSEITARFWLYRCLELGPQRAALTDRFLSWDQFKERCLRPPEGLRPANRALRTLYACRLLERNRDHPFLRRLVPPEHRGEPLVFAGLLRRLLPTLHRLREIEALWPATSAARREDLLAIWRDYELSLQAAGLYEPGAVEPRLDLRGGRWRIFFPETLEDYPSYSGLVRGRLRLTFLPPAGPPPLIRAFRSSSEEVGWLLARLAQLLDEGTEPAEMAVSVANLEEIGTYLRREAEVRAVPLRFHGGRRLDRYPAARLFSQIDSCVRGNFGLSAVGELLRNRAVPWRRERANLRLVRLGIDSRVLRGRTGRNGRDLWREALEREASPTLSRYWARLTTSLRSIHGAAKFTTLKAAIAEFGHLFLDPSGWQEEQLAVFQFILSTLAELEEAAGLLSPPPGSSPFALWLGYLGERTYVPQGGGGGIPVYPYPVAAGIEPRHHFVVGASEAATSRLLRRYPFLNVHEEAGLPHAQEELSGPLLQLLALSGATVSFSYPRQDPFGAQLPPAAFVSQGRVDFSAPTADADPFERERLAWTGSEEFPLLPVQRRGYLAAVASGLAPRECDYGRQAIQRPDLVERVAALFRDGRGLLRITPTALERFTECPFGYLLQRLGVEGPEPQTPGLQPRELGRLMHRLFQLFQERLAGQGPLDPAGVERYRALLSQACGQALAELESRGPVPIAPIWEDLRRRAAELADRFLEAELTEMAGQEAAGTEVGLEWLWPARGVALRGKMDRISRRAGLHTVVDYKKRTLPSRAEIFGPNSRSFQMAFYLYLMERHGLPVGGAAYYSIEEGRYRHVLRRGGRAMADWAAVSQAMAQLRRRVRAMADAVTEGRFALPRPRTSAQGCRLCRLREVCRDRYLVREPRGAL